ncbi:MAG: hypothetical protein CVV64_13260 [Candidatus Wallbacteria bacterium HGW-Wallbacteria-1]|jgi:exoribonuclease-2|uniref:RNB domain-containing protein n=1 Tax=Candidatus Wallbacteria bacterium HGW-Wallbacteria-1 TaxID=2013854 RepID=A0A2N1PMV1_9BACT|nr:MAG: hypothetical protein CVV64_13260 [Candidatus Wallbacteria bacterium HGW-Wallbacteria-1]
MSSHSFIPPSGSIVEFISDKDIQSAMVIDNSGGKARILLASKKELKIPPTRIMSWSGPQYPQNQSRIESAGKVEQHETRRRALRDDIDTCDLWEITGGEVRDGTPEWFSALLWDSPDPDAIAAMARALMNDRLRFKFLAGRFEILSHEEVETRLKALKAEEERQAYANEGQKLFRNLWNSYQSGAIMHSPSPESPESSPFADLIREKIGISPPCGDKKRETLWNLARKGLPELEKIPAALARAWGIVPWHWNPHLGLTGYFWGDQWWKKWNEQVNELYSRISEECIENSDSAGNSTVPLVSIDSHTTRDLDDAVWTEELSDGSFRAIIALARPDLHWPFGSDLDQTVMSRASSVYLPEGTSHMLPEILAADSFSLKQGQVRPSLIIEATTDSSGVLSSTSITTGFVCVNANMTYEQVEEIIEERKDAEAHETAHSLKSAAKLAEILRTQRVKAGAAIFDKDECRLTLSGEGPSTRASLNPLPKTPKAEILVSEMMILANRCVAKWASDNEIPLIYRTQEIAVPEDFAGVWTEPLEIYRRVRILTSTLLEVEPRRHTSLGLDAYCTVTSPIRRYSDLMNMAQMTYSLNEGKPRWNRDELKKILMQVTDCMSASGKIQKWGDRYWKLVLISQNMEQSWTGIILDSNQYFSTIAIPELQMNVRAQAGTIQDEAGPGTSVEVLFSKVDPLFEEFRVGSVRPSNRL